MNAPVHRPLAPPKTQWPTPSPPAADPRPKLMARPQRRWLAGCLCVGSLGLYVAPLHAQPEAAPQSGSPRKTPPPTAARPEGEIVPPQLLEQPAATYPPAKLAQGLQSTVVVELTVDPSGLPQDLSVVASGGPDFDAAALAAARAYRFTPASQHGVAVASRIRVPFPFLLPDRGQTSMAQAAPSPATVPPTAPGDQPPTTHADDGESESIDVMVRGQLPAVATRGSSDFVLNGEVLSAAPHPSAADMLQSAPGIYVAKPEGDAVAHEVFLRGFDAEHGQDIEFNVGGLPLNQPAHLHGQGYADLNLIIPEVVRSIRVTEGVYDPRQGDFAVAGSVDFDLGVAERGYRLQTTYGSFDSVRLLSVWAPEQEAEATFFALSMGKSAGFGENRGSQSGSAIGQYTFDLAQGFHGRAHVAAYAARANLAGILRRDDLNAARVDFYGSYDDPSANAQSASAVRAQAQVSIERGSERGARTGLSLWFSSTGFRSRENFSGYTQRSRLQAQWVGRGDLIEQHNDDLAYGASFFHRGERVNVGSFCLGQLEFGAKLRSGHIEQTQHLLQAPQNETWDERVDATVRATDLGGYLDADVRLGARIGLRGGVRADVLHYDIDDRLGNFIPGFQQQTHLPGYRRSALGFSFGPRATLQAKLSSFLTALASYGEGYRSPQARQLEEGENAPFTKVRTAEVGLRIDAGSAISATLATYATFLGDDLAFDPESGSLDRIGPTRRLGIATALIARPWPFAYASVSLTYVQATLTAPPPPTAEDPAPPFEAGQLLPYVPPLVGRADLSLSGELVEVARAPLRGALGLGASLLSARPLPYGHFSPAIYLLSLSGELRYDRFSLEFTVQNLLNRRYAASEYTFVSDWGTRPIPSLLPARHFAAGAPRSFNASLGLHL